jgi:hypothetical protein
MHKIRQGAPITVHGTIALSVFAFVGAELASARAS